MLYISVMAIFISGLFIMYFLLLGINKQSIEMSERLSNVENLDKTWMKYEEPVGESILSVLYNSIGGILMKLSPNSQLKKQKEMLDKAGILKDTTAEKYVARKALLTSIIVILTVLVFLLLGQNIIYSLIVGVFAILLINAFYKFYLAKKVTSRSDFIVKSLPFTLDLITVSVEAGLSLDGAIGRIVNAIEGPLSDEFAQTLKEMRMGIEKKIALKNMSDRVGIKDVSMLLSSLIQADELGVSLGKILRIEGAQLREKRKQIAREKAMKAPVKMLFPLMLFIFPAIFVIILGPAMINIMDAF